MYLPYPAPFHTYSSITDEAIKLRAPRVIGVSQEASSKFDQQKSDLDTSALFSIREALKAAVKACDGPILGKRRHDDPHARDSDEVDSSQRPQQHARITGPAQQTQQGPDEQPLAFLTGPEI